jgi:signal transduction histidine kinase
MLLVTAALASNVIIAQMPQHLTSSTRFATGIIVCDTLWVTVALLCVGNFGAEFFYLYFFVLLLAAIGESLQLIAIGACVVCGAYLFGDSVIGGHWPRWSSQSLIRLPFLFSTAVFYGYLVDRTRREERRADDAEALAAQLERTLGEFRILYARAQEADRVKTEFLATVSHELRTPLTSLLGYVELLIDGSYGLVSDDQRKALGRVRSASEVLQHAISRMLDASRIEFGHEKLHCEEFELAALFDDMRPEFTPRPNVALHWPPATGVPALRTDSDKLRTILRNLVENALKYTPNGLVTVDARWVRQSDDVEIRVADTGIGIATEELDSVFEAFSQGSNRDDPREKRGGVGLGLYIVQRLANRLGGEVAVAAKIGAGSTFTLRIPRLLHRGAAVAVATPAALPAMRDR